MVDLQPTIQSTATWLAVGDFHHTTTSVRVEFAGSHEPCRGLNPIKIKKEYKTHRMLKLLSEKSEQKSSWIRWKWD